MLYQYNIDVKGNVQQMDNKLFNNSQEFIRLFNLENSLYDNVTPFKGKEIGFSTQRAYPEDIRFVTAKTKDGKPDTVAIIHIAYAYPAEAGKQISPQKVPIIIRIAKFSRYRTDHLDYNFDDSDCPTEESLRIMKNSPKPIDLETDEYFYNHSDIIFCNENGERFSGIQLLDNIFNQHCDTVHWIKGIKIRWKLRSNQAVISLLSLMASSCRFVLYHIFGRTLDSQRDVFAYIQGYKEEDMKKLSTESLKIFDYKASKNVIVVFSFIILILYVFQYFYPLNNDFLENLFSINLYSVAFVICIIWIMDDILPKWLFKFMNLLIKIRTKLYFKRFKT